MNSKLRGEHLDELFKAILTLENIEECYMLFEDLCTVSEIKAMEQRFQVAKMLDAGMVYSDIAADTGASSATISRVGRALNYGSDGYKIAIERTKKDV